MSSKKTLSNWGNYPEIESEVFEFEFLDQAQKLIKDSDQILARGNGRCYGDAALGKRILSTLKLDKLLAFDAQKGILTCQSGVLLSDILDFIVPHGFFLPVTPGTKFITVGGAIAADVHGKNHHKDGCFSDHLLHFKLVNEEGKIMTCSAQENSELFWATVGGMGLTGVIISASFSLKTIESVYIRQESIKAKNLEEIMQLFEESESWTYTVAWIDCLQKGDKQGRSLLMRGEHARLNELSAGRKKHPLKLKAKKKITIPSFFPSFMLNNLSVKAFNFLFYNKQFSKKKESIIDYDSFFYPLDALYQWNRIYGKAGFTQYQFVIPKGKGLAALKQVLDMIRESKQGSFLTVLKLFGTNNPKAYKSFPMEGYTLALDFKINKGLPPLIAKLDEVIAAYQGKIYLAKDAFSKKSLFQHPHLEQSPEKFQAIQAERLFKD